MTLQQGRVAIGAPVFNRAEYVGEAIESLLAQTYRDFALVVVDDCSTDATPDIVRRYAAQDPRVHYERNPRRIGMVANWQRAYRVAVERAAEFEYFAFASDHDLWHPRWLESMVRELDADPGVVVAFPLWVPIREDGTRIDSRPRQRWETAGLQDPVERVRRVSPGRKTPNVIYGLFRARALERCGVYAFTLAPDRLLMAQLAVLGTFRQVPRELWMRRLWTNQHERSHQRTRLFAGTPPLHTYVPTGLVHGAKLLQWLVVVGGARPEVGRGRGIRVAAPFVRAALLHPTLRWSTGRRWARRRREWARRRRRWRKTTFAWSRNTLKASGRLRRRVLRRVRSTLRSRAGSVSRLF